MRHSDLGGDDDTTVVLETAPADEQDGTRWYKSVLVVPGAAKRLVPFLRPYVEVDACHMKHLQGGNLYTMVGVDAQGGTVTLAYAHAGNEDEANWCWFLDHAKRALALNDAWGDTVVCMSDRAKGLAAAVDGEWRRGWVPAPTHAWRQRE